MPPAIVAAGISAVGALGGAALSARSQGKASDAQSKATSEALAFQKEEARLKREADERRWAAWNAGREKLMQMYGIDIAPPSMPGSAPGGGAPGGMPGGAPGAGPPAMASTRPMGGPGNIRDLMSTEAPPELGEWSNWARYGLGGPRGA